MVEFRNLWAFLWAFLNSSLDNLTGVWYDRAPDASIIVNRALIRVIQAIGGGSDCITYFAFCGGQQLPLTSLGWLSHIKKPPSIA